MTHRYSRPCVLLGLALGVWLYIILLLLGSNGGSGGMHINKYTSIRRAFCYKCCTRLDLLEYVIIPSPCRFHADIV